MVQPATRRLITEQKAADTYATKTAQAQAITDGVNTQVPIATAALPKGIVATARSNMPANVTLTAGRLYRITAHVQPSTNASVIAGARIHAQAGATAPAVGAGTVLTPVAYSAINGTGGTGFPSLMPTGVFSVGTTGAFSFALNITGATGTGGGFSAVTGALEYVLEDVGATGAAGTGRAPGVTL